MRDLLITRRRLLVTAGSGILGVTVLNTVTGCTSDSDPATPPAASAAPAATETGATAPGTWRRVDLSFVSAYLLVRGNEAAVVDLGTSGSAEAIGAGLQAAGSGWNAVRHVILTHKHADHAGSLGEVEPQVDAAFHAGAADIAGLLPDRPLKPLRDGDEIFGLQIIGTPGHTAGHVSVFDPATGTLVAGDALRTTNGLEGPDPQYTEDAAQGAASVRKLAGLTVQTILPGHGAPLTDGAAEALSKLAATLKG